MYLRYVDEFRAVKEESGGIRRNGRVKDNNKRERAGAVGTKGTGDCEHGREARFTGVERTVDTEASGK